MTFQVHPYHAYCAKKYQALPYLQNQHAPHIKHHHRISSSDDIDLTFSGSRKNPTPLPVKAIKEISEKSIKAIERANTLEDKVDTADKGCKAVKKVEQKWLSQNEHLFTNKPILKKLITQYIPHKTNWEDNQGFPIKIRSLQLFKNGDTIFRNRWNNLQSAIKDIIFNNLEPFTESSQFDNYCKKRFEVLAQQYENYQNVIKEFNKPKYNFLNALNTSLNPYLNKITVQYFYKETQLRKLIATDKITTSLNPLQLNEVVSNLIDNAIKYSPNAEDKITVSLSIQNLADNTPEYILEFSVKDNGIGFPPNEIETILTQGIRGSNVGNISGTGSGLKYVKQLLDTHLSGKYNYNLWITSPISDGKGSKVTCTLGRFDNFDFADELLKN